MEFVRFMLYKFMIGTIKEIGIMLAAFWGLSWMFLMAPMTIVWEICELMSTNEISTNWFGHLLFIFYCLPMIVLCFCCAIGKYHDYKKEHEKLTHIS